MQLHIEISPDTDAAILVLKLPSSKVDFVKANIGTTEYQHDDELGCTEDISKLGITTSCQIANAILKNAQSGDYKFFELIFTLGVDQTRKIPQFTQDLINWVYTEEELTKFDQWWG